MHMQVQRMATEAAAGERTLATLRDDLARAQVRNIGPFLGPFLGPYLGPYLDLHEPLSSPLTPT